MNSLYLNVTEQCNMRCEYCYGNYGPYYKSKPSPNMTYETACMAIQKAQQIYKNRLRVVFFGGEPLLCISLIKRIVNRFCSADIQFGLITNGLLLNKETIEFLVAHNFAITISFEGDASAQSFRRTPDESHTYSTVLRNIELLDQYNSPYNIRMTLFRGHVNLLERIRNIAHLKNIRDVRCQFCSPTGCQCDLSEEDFDQYSLELEKLCESKLPILSKCKLPHRKNYHSDSCTMGITGFAVDSEGKVYPCYRFIGKQEYCLGHIEKFDRTSLWSDALLRKLTGEYAQYCYAEFYLK